MTRREKRIKNIRSKISRIENEIAVLTRDGLPKRALSKSLSAKVERLYDRRDSWEERLVQAELGTPQVYSRGAVA